MKDDGPLNRSDTTAEVNAVPRGIAERSRVPCELHTHARHLPGGTEHKP